ncbi:MAG: SDR family oxidoreductase [Burkholderiales bacterium]|nr:SDR family oxidoreductase [Burkholderiales bacterium]
MAVVRKVAIVTGSASGIGAATAEALAGKGVNVLVNYSRSRCDAQSVATRCEALGVEAAVHQADVSDDAACRAMAQAAMARWGRIDYLVNNAGTTRFVEHADLEGLGSEDFLRIYAVNVVGAFQMVRAVAPHMKQAASGAIVNVSALAALTGSGSCIAYAASKAALNSLTVTLARALGPQIRVNAVCPGFVKSRWMEQGLGSERYASALRKTEANAPLRAASTPQDVAEPIVWLLEAARHVTGELLMVDAGFRLARP